MEYVFPHSYGHVYILYIYVSKKYWTYLHQIWSGGCNFVFWCALVTFIIASTQYWATFGNYMVMYVKKLNLTQSVSKTSLWISTKSSLKHCDVLVFTDKFIGVSVQYTKGHPCLMDLTFKPTTE